ncbi:MAG TPA: hypothetical protein VN671_11535, partial [Solirubrobacterales bacterium]|nr:hypothetical protein [Solirubrobacterales bacterium]
TWSHGGIPAGVKPVGRVVPIAAGNGLAGILWTGSDGNVYDTQAPGGVWETWSPTWNHNGIPAGVRALSSPAIWRAPNGSWAGAVWTGSDGNIYETHGNENGEWSSFSPTWNRNGLAAGVKPLGDPVVLPSASGSTGIAWPATDGNVYITQAPAGTWESYSPTWNRSGIPSGVRPVASPAVIPSGQGWNGFLWPGSDGNLYETQASGGVWSSFSPTWNRHGIPAGVGFAR